MCPAHIDVDGEDVSLAATLPFPPAGRVFGLTILGNVLLGISVLPE